MRRVAALLAAVTGPAVAQHAHMPGMVMPGDTALAGRAEPVDAPTSPARAKEAGRSFDKLGTSGESVGAGEAPAVLIDRLADRYWGTDAMARAEAAMRREHGGMATHMLLFNLAEYQARARRDGYRWDGEAWFGGDIDRLTIKTEGEGGFGGTLEAGEVQALWSHALDPYWNVQAGVRYDVQPGPSRGYATIGVEGLAPYWFEVEGALFVSEKGDVLARLEGWHDMRLTNYVVLQPRAELNLAAQDVRATRTGAGLSSAELGLRLRYEGRRELAPYVGLSWERRLGETADLARAAGDDTGGFAVVAGVRTWF